MFLGPRIHGVLRLPQCRRHFLAFRLGLLPFVKFAGVPELPCQVKGRPDMLVVAGLTTPNSSATHLTLVSLSLIRRRLVVVVIVTGGGRL